MAGTKLFIVFLGVVSVTTTISAATDHVVGGMAGWSIPLSDPSFYAIWAASQTFAVGDTLGFNFTTGKHNVVEVAKSSYDACSNNNQIGSTLSSGPATVTIATPGNHYYICGVLNHCSLGQKLAVIVGSSTPGPASGNPAGNDTPSIPVPPSGGNLSPSSAVSSSLSLGGFVVGSLVSAAAIFMI